MYKMAVLLILPLFFGCGQDSENQQYGTDDYDPLIMIVFRGTEASPELPWSLCNGRDDVSGAMLISDDIASEEAYGPILDQILENGLLIASVRDHAGGRDLGPDQMMIWTDEADSLITEPPEIAGVLPGRMNLDSLKNHPPLLELFDIYKPDIVFMEIYLEDPGTVEDLSRYWIAPEVLSAFRVIIHCPMQDREERGWCIFAGRNVNGTIPPGLTDGGYYATVRILAGLDWLDCLPESVPAVSILENTEEAWVD